MKLKKLSILNFEIIGTIFVFIMGVLLHFTYEWSNKNWLVGVFSPVNESVWEHLKLVFFPMVVIGVLGMFYFRKDYPSYLGAKVKGILLVMAFIVVFFYTYSGVIGKNIAFLDIGSFFVGVLIGQVYAYKRIKESHTKLSYIVLLMFMLMFGVFTFVPPHLGIFRDSVGGSYGVNLRE